MVLTHPLYLTEHRCHIKEDFFSENFCSKYFITLTLFTKTCYFAGYNPKHFKGTNTGVFIAAMWPPLSFLLVEPDYKIDQYAVKSQAFAALIANRISFWLDTEGD